MPNIYAPDVQARIHELSLQPNQRVTCAEVIERLNLPRLRVYSFAVAEVLRGMGARAYKSNGIRAFIMPPR